MTPEIDKIPVWDGTEFHHHMFAKSRRTLTQVNGHIEHIAFHHAHQLGLRIASFLVMQASQNAIARLRFVLLHKLHLAYMRFKSLAFPLFKEISPAISKDFWIDSPHS